MTNIKINSPSVVLPCSAEALTDPKKLAIVLRAEADIIDPPIVSPPPPPNPPPPPGPVESATGTRIIAGVGEIISKDLASWTVRARAAGNLTDMGLYRNSVYVGGAYVTSLTYEGDNTFLETTTAYGSYRKKWDGSQLIVSGPITPPSPPPPVTPPPPPSTPASGIFTANSDLTKPFRAPGPSGMFDDFNGTALDPAKWGVRPANFNGDTRNDPNAHRVENGKLIMFSTAQFKTPWIYTKNQYGRGLYEVRVKTGILLPGCHFGAWAVHQDPALAADGAWPQGGEIDYPEHTGNKPRQPQWTVHFGFPQPTPSHTGANPNQAIMQERTKAQYAYHGEPDTGVQIGAQFVVFSLHWHAAGFDFYFNRKLSHQTKKRGDEYPFNRPFVHYLSMSMSTGDSWFGKFPAGGALPQAEVEWWSYTPEGSL